ncbi:hypothetical protein [Phocoenobacter skyensis]|uniref:Uncharacterized protein n=1 Tax=Phocoenobacter skyensis TaxID=97481 RepID=A0A1H7VL21_9PAST|nr:hypothetical protein [Pasteurella skyensis]MDP8078823.1 hypothetical protein [Pasteurella skyensis]MDP8084864.1 hypothetical protein [Pasteurella skyensis]MDP8185494.1 hypothetical protein [Pasteurella skyensis]QLB22468.1 hypothetical protein A6B44_04320 [Pasteurella skyensis]SEM09860.1 hypothetical protein SAMN05444853_10513 [Pasteurella skyensis]
MKKNSFYFYDPIRAFDVGFDFVTKEKHHLVVIAKQAGIALVKLLYEVYEKDFSIPFNKEELENDYKKIGELGEYFKQAKETKSKESSKWSYELDFDKEILKLDNILIKYIEFFESDDYKKIAEQRYKKLKAMLKEK